MMTESAWLEKSGIRYVAAKHWIESGINHGFLGVDVDVRKTEDIQSFLAVFGMESQKGRGIGTETQLMLLKQVHGTDIVCANATDLRIRPEGDAWIALPSEQSRHLLLGIITADCFPVLVRCSISGIVGAAHCGWRSAVAGLLSKTLQMMKKEGAELSQAEVVIGPGAGCLDYEIGKEIIPEFLLAENRVSSSRVYIESSSVVLKKRRTLNSVAETYYADISQLLKLQSLAAGVSENKLIQIPFCTIRDSRFFSHRRQGASAGRQLSFIEAVSPNM